MKKFLFVLASTAALITPAVAEIGGPAFPPFLVPDSAPQYRWEDRPPPSGLRTTKNKEHRITRSVDRLA
jgi:hypothetical protein